MYKQIKQVEATFNFNRKIEIQKSKGDYYAATHLYDRKKLLLPLIVLLVVSFYLKSYLPPIFLMGFLYFKIYKSSLLITYTSDLEKMSDSSILATLAHEYAHIHFYQKINSIFWSESRLERTCDMEVIRRGFGEELLHFHNEHNKVYKKYKKNEGLTKKEIKNILKSNKLPFK